MKYMGRYAIHHCNMWTVKAESIGTQMETTWQIVVAMTSDHLVNNLLALWLKTYTFKLHYGIAIGT